MVALVSRPPERPVGYPAEAVVIRPEVARLLLKSSLPLVVDFYWLQSIHVIGAGKQKEEGIRLYRYAKFITELDPKFYQAYWALALNIPWNMGRRHWVNCDEAVEIYQRGLKQFPDDLRLKQYLAWNYFDCNKDFVKAADVLKSVARDPKSPPSTWSLATRLYAQSGSPDDGLALARDMLANAKDDAERALFQQRIEELEVEKILQGIDAAISKFTAEVGRSPQTLEELVIRGYLATMPVDPYGGTISIGEDHRASSTSQGRRLEIFIDEKTDD